MQLLSFLIFCLLSCSFVCSNEGSTVFPDANAMQVIDDTARAPDRFAQPGDPNALPGGAASFDAEEDEDFEIEDDSDDDDVLMQEPTRPGRGKSGGGGSSKAAR